VFSCFESEFGPVFDRGSQDPLILGAVPPVLLRCSTGRPAALFRPVTFRYQKPFADGSKPIQYGLIAEEVAGVYPDLVAHSADGQIETVKYQVLDSMLLNEVQRLNKENQALQERLSKLEAVMASVASSAGVQ